MNKGFAARRGGLAALALFSAATLLAGCAAGGGAAEPEAGDGTGELNIWSLFCLECELLYL